MKNIHSTPSATDVDNDPLTFSVNGEPNWLDIDAVSGALTGTPQLGDVGTYPGIVVSVSDGSLSASLPQFTVDVVQNANGSVSLSWTAPTLNEDGTALTDLAGYKIHYGTSSGNYTVEIPVDLGTTTLMVDNLTPDTYYFAATAINSSRILRVGSPAKRSRQRIDNVSGRNLVCSISATSQLFYSCAAV